MPKVSVCIPTYNQIEHLRRTLESVLIQTYKNYELIITDDSTTPLVKDLTDQFDFDGRLKYYHNNIPLGSPQNWNHCISMASGDFIKIIHHDDWFTDSNSLEEYVQYLVNNPNIDLAFSTSHVLLADGENWDHTTTDEQLDVIKTNPAILFIGNTIGGPSAIIFRNKIELRFDTKLKWLVDIDFYINNISKYKSLGYIKSALITTFAAVGRISDSCIDNKQIEVFEYFYLYEKLIYEYPSTDKSILNKCLGQLLTICSKYNITKISDIRACGFDGRIQFLFRLYMFLNRTIGSDRISHYSKKLIINLS
ncbi:glycosyltransferase family 2 protein [Flavihumibacter sp. R14]|nr:glycosyltransferase family 2 protein [Flavihumibacter soli]